MQIKGTSNCFIKIEAVQLKERPKKHCKNMSDATNPDSAMDVTVCTITILRALEDVTHLDTDMVTLPQWDSGWRESICGWKYDGEFH